MQSMLDQYWAMARKCEAAGDMPGAERAYRELLRLDAGQALAWSRLSEFAQRGDRYRDAYAHAMRAAAAAAANKRYKIFPYLTQQLLAFDERQTVRELIENAEWSHPDILGQSAVLSQRLWLADGFETALRLIDHAIARVPASHLLTYARGNALRYLGRADEATEAFERCLAMSPYYAYAHWSLAYHAKAAVAGSRIDRIRAAQAQWPADAPEQSYLGYALFKEWDDAGETERAWEALRIAAHGARRRIVYDPAQEQRGLEALRDLTGPGFAGPGQAATDGKVPIFIVGMPRTGTTLLDRILSNHSAIASTGELNLFTRALSWASDHFYDVPPRQEGLPKIADADFAAAGAFYLQRTAGLYAGKSHLIDKNPANIFNAGFIARAIPQAKILCLLRDPMDTCFSNLKELFSDNAYGYSYDLIELADHYVRFRGMVEHWRQAIPDRFHVVEYEALVSDPLRTTEEAMRFCGVAFEPESIDITRNEAPVSTASSSQVRQPINARSVGAWKAYRNPLEPMRARIHESLSV